MAYLLCQEPGPAIAESFRLAQEEGQRVAIGREYGMWYVRTLGSRED